MKNLMTFDEFVEKLYESGQRSKQQAFRYRQQKLADIPINEIENKYCIAVSIGESDGRVLITEHEKLQSFTKTTNRYLYHPENPDIPVQAHYHIYPNNGKKEIYAVNMDGTAHHKKNRGYEVPKKEADELRKLGVEIPEDRIIENIQMDFPYKNSNQAILIIE